MFKFCRFIFFTKLFEIYKKIDFFAFLPYLFRNVVILIQIVKNAKFPNDKENNFQVWFFDRGSIPKF